MVSRAGIHKLHVTHGIRRHTGDLCGASNLTGDHFGHLGDVEGGKMDIVRVTESLLDLTDEVNVCTLGHLGID